MKLSRLALGYLCLEALLIDSYNDSDDKLQDVLGTDKGPAADLWEALSLEERVLLRQGRDLPDGPLQLVAAIREKAESIVGKPDKPEDT